MTSAGRLLPTTAGSRRSTSARSGTGLAALGAAVLVGVVLLEPRLGPNAALVDPLLTLALLLGLLALAGGKAPPALAAWRQLCPWLLLIALGTVLSLYTSGVAAWAVLDIAQSVYSVAAFFGMYAVFWSRRHLMPVFGVALAVGIVVTTVALAATLQPEVRPSGTFYHPNYAGHYLVTSAFVCWYALPWRWMRWVVAAVAAVGVFLTASFGALLMCAVLTVHLTWRPLRSRPWLVAYGTAAVVLGLWLGGPAVVGAMTTDYAASDTLTSARFERSGDGRLAVWRESLATVPSHPFGVGPDGLHNLGLISVAREPHNLYVAYLAELGALGFVGLVGLGVALWRHAPRGGVTRALLLALAASNLVRETFHYRHMWLALALALVIDQAAERRSAGAAPVRPSVSGFPTPS